jgi:hypothetical protein
MCQNKVKRNHTHDFASFYSGTFPLSSYSTQLFIEEYTSAFFFLTVRCNRSFDTVLFYCHYICLGIIGDGSILILLVMQAPDSINPSVLNFSFLISFFIIYSRKVQVKYIADTRLQERNQEKHMVI